MDHGGDALAERRLVAEAAAEHEQLRVERVREHREHLAERRGRLVPDRHAALPEGSRKRGAVGEHGLAAPVGPGRKLLSREDATALAVDEACGDLRAADVDPDRPRSASRAVQNAALTAL